LPPEPTILAIGGHWLEPGDALDDFVVELTGKEHPRVLLIPTARGDNDAYIVDFYAAYGPRVEASHLKLFQTPPPDLRNLVLGQDAIFVAGGSLANLLAVWRLHGLDAILREAWERGIVLAGSSAGSLCWFEAGVTDSFRAELDPIECLGFLPGSNCPHYDSQEQRRPVYRRLVADGFPPGLAADDEVGLLFRGTEFVEAVTSRTDGAGAYHVSQAGEERIEPRRLRTLG
jgi:dipeptidase E